MNNAEHGNILPGSGAICVCAQLQIPSLSEYVKIHIYAPLNLHDTVHKMNILELLDHP